MYKFTDAMQEISGFGGSYELGRREMVTAGAEWLDDHPNADPKFHGYKGIYGLIDEDNQDAKDLVTFMVSAADKKFPNGGVTGAMLQATVSHVMFIKKNGWQQYVFQMSRKG